MAATPPHRSHGRRLLDGVTRGAGRVASLIASLVVGAALVTAGLIVAGYRPTTDRGNSMLPDIHRGDVLFSRSILASQVRVGDVITFPDPYFKGVLLTHRIRAEATLLDGRIAFTTRGDANTGSEYWSAAASARLTRVAFRVPDIGAAFIAIDGHPLWAAIAVTLALWLPVLWRIWLPGRSSTREPPPRELPRHARRLPLLGLAALLLVVPAATAAVAYVTAPRDVSPAVRLTVNDQGGPLFDLRSMSPGETAQACELVTNQGPADADVGIYGDTTGIALAGYLHLRITRGTLPRSAAPGSCDGFAPDTVDYVGDRPGLVYDGALSALPSTPDAALSDPEPDWPAWDAVAYRMTVSLGAGAGNSVQGLSTVQRFYFAANAGSSGPAGPAGPTGSGGPTGGSTGATGWAAPPAIGQVEIAAAPNGSLTSTFTMSSRGSVTAVANLVQTVTGHVKVGSNAKLKKVTKLTLLGRGRVTTTAAGTTRIVIAPLARALKLYRAHPKRYRISVRFACADGTGAPYVTTKWVSARVLAILAHPPKVRPKPKAPQ